MSLKVCILVGRWCWRPLGLYLTCGDSCVCLIHCLQEAGEVPLLPRQRYQPLCQQPYHQRSATTATAGATTALPTSIPLGYCQYRTAFIRTSTANKIKLCQAMWWSHCPFFVVKISAINAFIQIIQLAKSSALANLQNTNFSHKF